MGSRRFQLLVAAFVLVGVGACDDGSGSAGRAVSTTQTTAATPEPLPAGFRRIDVADEGYSVAVPEAWRDLPFDEAAVQQLIDANREGNPELARLLETRRRDTGSNLLVVDERAPGANLNVLRVAHAEPLPASALNRARDQLLDPEVTAAIDAQLMSVSARDVTREPMELPAGPAVKASYVLRVQGTGGEASEVFGVQYYVPAEQAVFILSLSTTNLDAYAADFDRIAQTFAVR